jgi:hypothetical protein
MALSWVSVSATTGRVIADLPTLRVDGALKRTLMRYESQTASLPMGNPADPEDPTRPPDNWRQATRKGAAFLVALDEEETPLWGGLVVRRNTSEGPDAKLTLASAEAYFDRVYVGDVQFSSIPQNSIVQTLIETYAGPAQGGLPLRVEVVGGLGVVRDQAFRDLDDKTLYSVLTDMSGMLGGPEWTVGWEWTDEQTLGLVAYVGDRVGSAPPPGLGPSAQFHLPGSVTTFDLDEGYGNNEGANDVTATISTARSPRQIAPEDGRPRFEYRWSPDNVSTFDDLVSHATRGLTAMREGTVALRLSASRTDPPYLGRDWDLGDDIGFDLTAPAWPEGITGTARAVGWELTDDTVTPLIDVTGIRGLD